jgi:ribosomal subunit interface protein
VDIVVTGRNVEVPEHYRTKVADKLSRIERYDSKIVRAEIELSHETNRRLSKVCQKVEITLVTKGPAVRSEAKAENFYAALEQAMDKLETRARKAADRRHHRQHDRTPITAVAHDGELTGSLVDEAIEHNTEQPENGVDKLDGSAFAYGADGGPGRIVRVKDHPADPTTVDQALFQMELVGHDFYLFNDADTGLPTVVYRRHGFDYGLIRLS